MGSVHNISREIRASAWDIAEIWAGEIRVSTEFENQYLSHDAGDLFNEFPTLVGGIAKIIEDSGYMADAQCGGALNDVAAQLGRFRYQEGASIETLMRDFARLREEISGFCARSSCVDATDLLGLERAVAAAVDSLAIAAVRAFWRQSTESLVKLSARDELTGLMCARLFENRLIAESAKAKRHLQPLTLMRVDIDDFRSFNSEQGSLLGNRLLREAASGVLAEIRTGDEAARLGGDEFGILLPQTGPEGAVRLADRIRRRVRQSKRDKTRPVTVSIGIAAYLDGPADAGRLMQEAACALEAARAEGGDVVRT